MAEYLEQLLKLQIRATWKTSVLKLRSWV